MARRHSTEQLHNDLTSYSPGGGNGNPLQYSGLENTMGRGAWWATVHGVAKSWTELSTDVSMHTHTHTHTYG